LEEEGALEEFKKFVKERPYYKENETWTSYEEKNKNGFSTEKDLKYFQHQMQIYNVILY